MQATTEQIAKFDQILNLEDEVKIMNTQAAFRGAGVPVFVQERQDDSRQSAKDKLFAALDDLTADEQEMFGEYRKAARS